VHLAARNTEAMQASAERLRTAVSTGAPADAPIAGANKPAATKTGMALPLRFRLDPCFACIGKPRAVTDRPGFAAMLEAIAGDGVRTILIGSPDRCALP
jgi:hypothetical protein